MFGVNDGVNDALMTHSQNREKILSGIVAYSTQTNYLNKMVIGNSMGKKVFLLYPLLPPTNQKPFPRDKE